ncbi:Oidioi.mRNA.OKI2018_I69.XSR.g13968.t1.cds [Oikopleura dioica]|uniref:Oidioi.mRNA.OKI2018_I69.XSR.g13968.t1.cds n=1 Tax=Oikopleura dioica TaxID=34765 RepID=A0ABN7SD91_OIKDI|nr:Oidioi.mRNA.OKI2018_I69.XSR.g13968.t1.cds [Oikopleura dioica]
MPQYQRRGGIIQLQGVPLYLEGFQFIGIRSFCCLTKLDIEFAHEFLKSILPGGADPLFADDKLLSKTHKYQSYQLVMSRFAPPCAAYITSNSTVPLERGLFIKATKVANALPPGKKITARKDTKKQSKTIQESFGKKSSTSKNLAKKYNLDSSDEDEEILRKKVKK